MVGISRASLTVCLRLQVTEAAAGDAFVPPLQDSTSSEQTAVLLHETRGEIDRLRAELGLPAGLALGAISVEES